MQPTNTTSGHDGPDLAPYLNAAFILVTLGQIALNLLIGTMLFSNQVRRRNVTVINLLLVTVLASIPPAFLYVLFCSSFLKPMFTRATSCWQLLF